MKKTAVPTLIPAKIQPVEIVIEEEEPATTLELCGLCRTQSAPFQLHIFDEYNFSIIRKCIPFVNFNVSFIQKICVDCVAILNTFSSFIDKILIAQNIFNPEIVQQQQQTENHGTESDFTPPRLSSDIRPLPRIKLEPMTHEEELKVPYLKAINFANSHNFNKPNSSQKKLEILEIVDIKPLNFLPIETNALSCDVSDSYEEDECQILSPPQLKVEIAEDGENEHELIKNHMHLSTVFLHDHNYTKENQPINVRSVKKETENEIFDFEIPVESHIEVISYKTCCKKKFSSIRQYLLHKIKRHQQNPVKKCKICQKLFPNAISLRYHKISKCKSKNRVQYRKVINELKQEIEKSPIKQVNKVYSCPICSKSFKGPKNVYQHKLSHRESKNKCNICNKVYKRKHGLRQHIRAQHEKVRKFQCFVCSHRYALKGDVKKCKHRDLKKNK